MNRLFTLCLNRVLPLAGAATLLMFTGAAACGDDDDDGEPAAVPTGGTLTESPEGDETGTTTGTAGTTRTGTAGANRTGTPGSSATGTASPGGGGSQAGDRRTGVAEVDAIIDAIESRDTEMLAERASFIEIECVAQPQGAGSPPQCEPGEANGTPVQVFPIVGCEGEFIREDELEGYFEQRFAGDQPGLYAVVQHTEPPQSEQFPTGDYGAIFETSGQNGAMVGISESGEVVTFVTLCNASAEEILGAQSGDVVVEPDA